MSVKKEASGRRSVQVEVEVPGTPEEVWQAIATGPGISAWFTPAEFEEWKVKDPMAAYDQQMRSMGLLTDAALAAMTREIAAEIDEALAFAKSSPFPDPSEMASFTYAE